ncbi:MAG: c-type cytochrome [Marinirhabdus sp.]
MKHTFQLFMLSLFIVACNSTAARKDSTIAMGPKTGHKKPQSKLQQSMARGQVIYKDFCTQCHFPQGEGVGGSFPPLAGSDYLTDQRKASIRGVKYGQKGKITVNGKTYNSPMPPMGLSDKEVADVMNYIMNSWGNKQQKMVTVQEVQTTKKQ